MKFSDDFDGILDGGHTYKAIKSKISECDGINNKYVKIEIPEGLSKNQISRISNTRNSSESVKNLSIIETMRKMNFLKEQLETEDYYKHIT